MPRMYKAANINLNERKITGHSGKATMATRLYNAGFDDQMVKLKTGNRSDSIHRYKRPGLEMRKNASGVLTLKK